MKRSTDRILTTHVGSLARPHDAARHDEGAGERPARTTHELLDRQVRDAVTERVRQQVECGIDIVTDGEMSKVSFLGYVKDRLGGFEVDTGDVAAWRRRGRSRGRRLPRLLHRVLQEVLVGGQPAAPHHLHGPDQLRRPGAAADRHRQPEGGDRRPTTWPTCSCRPPARAGSAATSTTPTTRSTSHAVAEAMREEYLGHRRRRLHPAGRRPVPDRHAQRPDDGGRRARAAGLDARRGAEPRAPRHPDRERSATTRATASTTARG